MIVVDKICIVIGNNFNRDALFLLRNKPIICVNDQYIFILRLNILMNQTTKNKKAAYFIQYEDIQRIK